MAAGDIGDSDAKKVTDRRKESQDHVRKNYGNEFEEVWRAINCRTKPIMVRNSAGNEVEDPSRTNVCMPTLALITRRKKARLTANAPHINYIVPPDKDQMIAEQLTALAYQQYDRSGEAREHKRHVHQAVALGSSYTKVYWDKLAVIKQYRRFTQSLSRSELMKQQGAPPDEIDAATQQLGDQLSPDEQAQAIAQFGPQITLPVDTAKYEGPVVRTVFIGDMDYDPRVSKFADSDYHIESYEATDLDLQKWAQRTYVDPETQQIIPAFDPKALQDVVDSDSSLYRDKGYDDLKQRFRAAVNQTTPVAQEKRLLGKKKFTIYEQHEQEADGRMWITWVANERYKIGRMPYPWDLYGRTCFTELTPMRNILNPIGDSSPRMLRFLHALHNATVGARKDLVQDLLRPTGIVRSELDIPEEVIERVRMRLIVGKSVPQWIDPPNIPAQAFEEEAQILRMIALFEPSLNTVDTGTDSNPQSGKLATTAILNAKAADSLTQDEVNEVDYYFKELGEKKLAMLQQQQQEQIPIAGKYVSEALSERYGKTARICLDPMDIQVDIELEPEAGSMLSVDDELRRGAVVQGYQLALADPINWNTNYMATRVAGTLHGVDTAKAINQPQPPAPEPPRVNISVAVKFGELPAQAQINALQATGLIDDAGAEELTHRESLDAVNRVSKAADAAVNIASPAVPPEQEKIGTPKQARQVQA